MIKKIKAKNFLSWKDLEYDIASGVSLIEGYNWDDATPEGSGKSSCLNAICWGLFGKIPKDVNIDDVITEGEKFCKVEVYLSDGSIVVRKRGPNDLFIQSGEKIIKGKDAKETQEVIEKYVGLDFVTFCQSVYFAQNYENKFINASPSDKTLILSKIQDLDIFVTARRRAMDQLKDLDKSLELVKKDISHSETLLEHFETEKNNINDLKISFEEENKRKIERLDDAIKSKCEEVDESKITDNDKLDEAEKGIKELEKQWEELKEIQVKIMSEITSIDDNKKQKERLECDISNKKCRISTIQEKIKELENPSDTACPTCGTILEKADKNHFANAIHEKKEDILELEKGR